MRERQFLFLLLILVVLIELPFAEYITDDTFIHLQFAKNLLAGKGFSFNAGEPTYGFTSPLWVMLISAGGLTGAGLLAISKMLGLLALFASAILFYLLSLRVSSDRFLSRAAALVWIVNGWSVRWGISGMETSLMTAWVLACLYFFCADIESGRPRNSIWLLSLAILVRPEAIALFVICILATIIPWNRRTSLAGSGGNRKLGLSILISGAAVSVAWCSFALTQFGRVTPNTVAVKAGRFISPERLFEGLRVVGKILGSTNGPELILIAIVLIVAVVSRRLPGRLNAFHAAAIGWFVALPAVYVLRDVQVVSRYLVPIIPMAVLYGFLSLRWIGIRIKMGPRTYHRAITILCAGCMILNVSVLAFVAYPHTHSFSRDMRGSLVYLGKWFFKNTPPTASVAMPDIGAFAYYSERKVVDLGGLVTPAMIPILRDHELDEVLTRFLFAEVARPDYVVDRARSPRRLLGMEDLRSGLTPIVTTSVSNLGITRPGRVYYTAYRIDWEKLGFLQGLKEQKIGASPDSLPGTSAIARSRR